MSIDWRMWEMALPKLSRARSAPNSSTRTHKAVAASVKQRAAASEDALVAWNKDRSPTHGIAERLRAEKAPRPTSPAVRKQRRDAMKKRQAAALVRNTYRRSPTPDRSSYFPHQGARECARRQRQMAQAAA